MEEHAEAEVVQFGGFRFDRRRGCLLRQDGNGAVTPVAIGSRALDILGLLIDRHGDLVSKDEILNTVWPGVVEGANVTVQISALRRALDEGWSGPSLIQTIPGRGYRFVAPVTDWAQDPLVDPPAFTRDCASLRPRLSIVVLPFTNLSNDPDQQYFADGMTEDLTIELSHLWDMLVISCTTAFTYRNKSVTTKQIGRELGVRYVLEGSVRRLGNKVRISAQLIDAQSDAHLWTEQFDGDTGDLFALQNEVTGRIAVALNIELIGREADRPAEHPDAIDYVLRGRAAMMKPRSRDSYAEAIGWFERALALDARSFEAQSWLATALTGRVHDQMSQSPASDIARAETLADRALAAFPTGPLAHYAKAQVLRAQQRLEDAISQYERVLAINRNWVHAIAVLGWCKFMTGSIEELIPAQEQAIRLSPRDPQIYGYYFWIGQGHLLKSCVDEAILWLERARIANPEHPAPHANLASGYALRGDAERAAAELAEARRLSADGRYTSLARLRTVGLGAPKIHALFEATYFAGLRKAGMPEE
jgi:TolB-like protein/tetratricopeptide (TPR) repeat protein